MKTEFISYLFLSYLTLLVSGTPQFTTCPSDPVCLSQPVTYECNSGADSLTWIVLDTNGDRVGNPVVYTQFGNAVGATGSIGGQFDTVLTVGGSSLVSNITFTPTLSINNYIVQCGAAGTLVNCSIVIAGIPTPARIGGVSYGPYISTFMLFYWESSMSPCLSHYVLVTTSSMDDINYYNASASGYTLRLSVPSTNNTLYNYTVLTVDTGGRSSESPRILQFIANIPERVANLMLTQINYPTDTNDTVNITVSWTRQSVDSPLPGIRSYYIIYNVSGVLQNATADHYISSRNLSGFTVGLEYTVEMFADNPFGHGPTTSATITILATPPPPEISSTSTSVSSSNSVIRSTPTMTPSSSMTPPTSQASPLSGGAIAGIVVAIIVVIVVLVILVIAIICCLKKKNEDKPSSSVIPQQPFEATNYAQVDHSAKSSSSKKQAPPKPAKSTSQDPVVYSAIQKFEASHSSPPQEGTEYADLDHSASASGRYNQKPKDTSHQVTYSDVSHNSRR